jgi:hypothetical protein
MISSRISSCPFGDIWPMMQAGREPEVEAEDQRQAGVRHQRLLGEVHDGSLNSA